MSTLMMCLALCCPAASDGEAPRVVYAPWFRTPASLGQLGTQGLQRHTLRNNRSGEPARFGTGFSISFDATHLNVYVECDEPDMSSLRVNDDPNSLDIWQDDSVELFFDPGMTRSRYVQILIGAGGQAAIGFNGVYDPLGDVPLEVQRLADKWTVRVKIPFAALKARAKVGDQWGFDLFRTRRAGGGDGGSEQQGWNPTHSGYRKPALFGTLTFGKPFRPPADAPEPLRDPVTYERIDTQIARDLAGTGRWTREDMTEEMARQRTVRLQALAGRIVRLQEPVLVAATRAITDEPVFPWTVPTIRQMNQAISAAACPGEFEPASFILFATRPLVNVTVETRPLVSEKGNELDARVIDVRQVECWYQSGWPHVSRTGKCLVPELLVKDGSLIRVEPFRRENILGFTGFPEDTDTLQPFAMVPLESKQIWLTFRAPAGANAGRYHSELIIRSQGVEVARVPVRFRVYPFELAPPRLDYSLYYRLRPSRTTDPVATMQRMAEEIRNQVEHGINMPSTYIGSESLRPGGPSMEALEELTRIYRSLGLKDHPLILVTTAVGRQQKPEQLAKIREMTRKLVAWAKDRGYSDVYLQGIDEGSLDVLRAERQAFEAVNEAGGKVFVACGTDYFDAAGDVLNMPVMAGALRPDVAEKVKAAGHRPFSYANPQAGVELPATYRRNYGLRLWAAGYDGGFDYEYQNHNPDQAYDDFAQQSWRNHTMAYPTASGDPIDTRQWEGWREGVDDVRYLSTLLAILDRMEAEGDRPEVVRTVRQRLANVTGERDPDVVRREIAAGIMMLQE